MSQNYALFLNKSVSCEWSLSFTSHNSVENFKATTHKFFAWELALPNRNFSNERVSASEIISITQKSITAATKARSKFAAITIQCSWSVLRQKSTFKPQEDVVIASGQDVLQPWNVNLTEILLCGRWKHRSSRAPCLSALRTDSEVWPKPIPASNPQKYQPLVFTRQYLFPAFISALEKISRAISLDDFGHHSYCYEECSPIFWKAEICRGSQYVQPVTIRTSAIFWIFAKKTSWLTRIRLSSSREGEAPICVESGSWTP